MASIVYMTSPREVPGLRGRRRTGLRSLPSPLGAVGAGSLGSWTLSPPYSSYMFSGPQNVFPFIAAPRFGTERFAPASSAPVTRLIPSCSRWYWRRSACDLDTGEVFTGRTPCSQNCLTHGRHCACQPLQGTQMPLLRGCRKSLS